MVWIDLGNPYPRKQPNLYIPFDWPSGRILRLETPLNLPKDGFAEVVSLRRTYYKFGSLEFDRLSTLLWLSYRVQAWGHSSLGFPITQRPVPSAGAIHPIHILLNLSFDSTWWRYDAQDHSLVEVFGKMNFLTDVRDELNAVVPLEEATVLLFVAEPGKTFSKYEHACSLIWRDAGVLLGHLALTSAALKLNFCPLGLTGQKWVSKLDKQGNLVGVGMALLGIPI